MRGREGEGEGEGEGKERGGEEEEEEKEEFFNHYKNDLKEEGGAREAEKGRG